MIDHTEDPPIQKKNDKSNFFIYYLYPPGESRLKEWYFDWEVIKYKDKSSLIDSLTNNKREYYSGHVKNEEKSNENIITYYSDLNYIKYDEKIGYYIDFLRLVFENSHGEYLLYKRTKKEFMDVIANIGALFSTVKFVFSMIFSFYSKNYDNYEVMGIILNQPKERKENNMLNSTNKKEDKNNITNEINNIDRIIEYDSSRNKNELNRQEYNFNNDLGLVEENNQEHPGNPLKRLHSYDFFFNNVYSKCCKKIQSQELINISNDIIYKYLSIDSSLYNQIKLENLFKDYKWNNPELNGIRNNEMIIKLTKT